MAESISVHFSSKHFFADIQSLFIVQCCLCSIDYVKTYLVRHSFGLNTLS